MGENVSTMPLKPVSNGIARATSAGPPATDVEPVWNAGVLRSTSTGSSRPCGPYVPIARRASNVTADRSPSPSVVDAICGASDARRTRTESVDACRNCGMSTRVTTVT